MMNKYTAGLWPLFNFSLLSCDIILVFVFIHVNNMFYGVTVGASAEGATHLSSLLNATRGLNQTKKLWLCLENLYINYKMTWLHVDLITIRLFFLKNFLSPT